MCARQVIPMLLNMDAIYGYAIYGYMLITIIIMITTIVLVIWLWYRDPHQLIVLWNRQIKAECDKQDAYSLNGVPSYHDAWDCPNKTVTEFHRLINLNHDQILSEVLATMQQYPATSIDETNWPQYKWLKAEDRWHPIWVRFMGAWAGSAERLPTLKQITSMFPEVTTLHISVFHPGTTLVEYRAPFRAVSRYHYGLQVPDNDVGLKIEGFDVKWKDKEGFIWNDTLPHSAWNHTSKPRIVIFADIFRNLSFVNDTGSKLIYSLLQRSSPVIQIKQQLQQEGVIIPTTVQK